MIISDFKGLLEDNYILLLTSNSKEKKYINDILNNFITVTINVRGEKAYFGMIDSVFVLHISGESGVISQQSVGERCKRLLSDDKSPKPKLIILCGICWGDPEKVKLGNTIISNDVFTANQNSVTSDGHIPRIRTFNSAITIDSNDLSENIIHGAICSVESLIKNAEYRDNLLRAANQCIAGEMEAFALIPSLNEYNWLVIKNVSDFADDETYSMESQIDYCEILASDIEHIIPKIIKTQAWIFDIISDDALLIRDIMHGNSVEFNVNDFDMREMNTQLNDDYGPLILRKLNNYIDGEVFQQQFSYDMTNVILELIQNEFRHNHAYKVTVTFNNKSIKIESSSSNEIYDISLIKGGNGGSLAWGKFNLRYIKDESIGYSCSENIITFRLNKYSDRINEIKSKCKITFSTSKSGLSGYRPSIEFNEECDAVYYDVTNNLMMSRMIGELESINEIIKKGKIVYISVRDQCQKEEYIEIIKENTDKIKFLI